MEIRFDRAKWMQDSEGAWLSLRVQDWGAAKNFAASMKDSPYIARLSQKREHRSLDANAYLWVLCQKIAEAAGTTKDEVYLDAVRHAGQFEYLPIRADALEAFKRRWNGRGIGWPVEIVDDSKLPGYKKVIAYYGSSVYDTREMSVLLDYVVNTAKDMEIETATPDELARMMAGWDSA